MKLDDLKARLGKAAETASNIQRQMAEAKSLRQEGNVGRRTDLYMWPTPEQTLEGQALTAISDLEALVGELGVFARHDPAYLPPNAGSGNTLCGTASP